MFLLGMLVGIYSCCVTGGKFRRGCCVVINLSGLFIVFCEVYLSSIIYRNLAIGKPAVHLFMFLAVFVYVILRHVFVQCSFSAS
jgi:hypothetical protein